eukprot:gene1417-12037_t
MILAKGNYRDKNLIFNFHTDIMTPFNVMITCTPTTAVSMATSLMLIKRIGSMLVAENNVYFGFITKNDLLEAYNLRLDPFRTTLADIMKKDYEICYLGEYDNVELVAQTFKDKKIHHVLIKNSIGNVTGVISTFDLVKLLVSQSQFSWSKNLMTNMDWQ